MHDQLVHPTCLSRNSRFSLASARPRASLVPLRTPRKLLFRLPSDYCVVQPTEGSPPVCRYDGSQPLRHISIDEATSNEIQGSVEKSTTNFFSTARFVVRLKILLAVVSRQKYGAVGCCIIHPESSQCNRNFIDRISTTVGRLINSIP